MANKGSNILLLSHHNVLIKKVEQILGTINARIFAPEDMTSALSIFQDNDIHLAIIDTESVFHSPPQQTDNSENTLSHLCYLFTDDKGTSTIPFILIGNDFNKPELEYMSEVSYVPLPIVPSMLTAEVHNLCRLQQMRKEFQQLADETTLMKLELSKRNKQLMLSSQIARHINSILNLDELLHEIVQLIQTQFRYYFVSIWLISSESGEIELKAGSLHGGRSHLQPGFKLIPGKDKSIITYVCQHKKRYLAQNVAEDPYYLPTDALPDTKAELCLPLNAIDNLMGVIDIESDRVDVFHPDDVEILMTLADQTAIAIRNASLYHQVLQASEDLEEKINARTNELKETNRQLELLEQNKTDFIQILSHELRTPLTLVNGYAELLLTHEQAEKDSFLRQPILGVMTGAQRLQELIDSMVDMLKIDSRSLQLMPQTLSIENILTPLLGNLSEVFNTRHLNLVMDNITDLPEIEGDLDLLGKVFEHLINNAIKYTPDGGRIDIYGRYLHQNFDDILEEFVEVAIHDTGIGISAEQLDIIFTKFYTTADVSLHSSGKTKFKGGGPGLGLSIARGIVEAHQGRIWAESPGYDEATCPGSTFYILLPLRQER